MSAELAGERVRIDITSGVITAPTGGQALGHVSLEDEGDTLVIRELCIDAARRGLGAGSECARLIRGYAEAGRWRALRAWAPPDVGLAVYFWSRMGFRPLFGDGPDGGIWFERRFERPSPD